MTEQISALIDGELGGFDAASLNVCMNRLCDDPALRRDWALAHLIGDHLRGHLLLVSGFSLGLTRRLAAEPALATPRRLASPRSPFRLALAVAASVLGAAAVSWAVLAMNSQRAFDVAIAPAGRPMQPRAAAPGPDAGDGTIETSEIHHRARPSLINALRQE